MFGIPYTGLPAMIAIRVFFEEIARVSAPEVGVRESVYTAAMTTDVDGVADAQIGSLTRVQMLDGTTSVVATDLLENTQEVSGMEQTLMFLARGVYRYQALNRVLMGKDLGRRTLSMDTERWNTLEGIYR